MKIQCNVCKKDSASVFCSADDAALCDACDHRVHHANKLAGKHHRFSLLHHTADRAPLCDICQERRAFLFCQQDRAILCRDCDVPIHKASEHTQNHNRFLLTGIKLSPALDIYPLSTPSSNNEIVTVPNLNSQVSIHKPVSLSPTIPKPQTVSKTTGKIVPSTSTATAVTTRGSRNFQKNKPTYGGKSGLTSSISEYLIDFLPGWQVEDFLDSPATLHGCNKAVDNEVLSFWDSDLSSNLASFPSENMEVWVPQAQAVPQQSSQSHISSETARCCQIGFMDSTKMKSRRNGSDDSCFTVPQINSLPNSSKRSRTCWK